MTRSVKFMKKTTSSASAGDNDVVS